MTERNGKPIVAIVLVVLAAAAAMLVGTLSALAVELTADQIVEALRPRGLTRALPSVSKQAVEERRFIDSLRNRGAESFTTEERTRTAAIAARKPSTDLTVNFEFDSAALGPDAEGVLTQFGSALRRPELTGQTIWLAGHTDAKGTEAYNHGLSERRADAVKRFLIERFGITANLLIPQGFGKVRLKDPTRPFAAVNRRVHLSNLSAE